MAETNVNISITTTGASQARTALDQAAGGLDNINKNHDAMSSRFQQRIQHVGLRLFANDALRAIGLGGEARMAVNLLNSALMAGETAAGIGSGGIMLVVTALGVLVGAGVKVYEHFKDQKDMLEKMLKAYSDAQKPIEDHIKTLEKYKESLGFLPPIQQKVYDELKRENDYVRTQEIPLLTVRIAQLKAITEGQKSLMLQLSQDQPHDWAEKFGEVKTALSKNIEEMGIAQTKLDLYGGSKKNDLELLQKQADAQKTANDALQKRIDLEDKLLSEHSTKSNPSLDFTSGGVTSAPPGTTGYHQTFTHLQKESEAAAKRVKDQWKSTADSMYKGFGDATAKMIVEGKSMSDILRSVFIQILESWISMVAQMIAQWLILKAVTSGFMPSFGMASVGGGGGVSGGVGAASVGNVTVNVHGAQDANAVANQVGAAIISRIRGRGDLNFVRG